MHPNYFAVFREFARNSLVREMTFRGNFLLDCVSSLSWVFMQLGLYLVIFEHTDQLGSPLSPPAVTALARTF